MFLSILVVLVILVIGFFAVRKIRARKQQLSAPAGSGGPTPPNATKAQ